MLPPPQHHLPLVGLLCSLNVLEFEILSLSAGTYPPAGAIPLAVVSLDMCYLVIKALQ